MNVIVEVCQVGRGSSLALAILFLAIEHCGVFSATNENKVAIPLPSHRRGAMAEGPRLRGGEISTGGGIFLR